MNILIGTAIVWILSAIFVAPLTAWLTRRRLAAPEFALVREVELAPDAQARCDRVAKECYILADVAVLGVAGLIGGLMGYWFIGISTKAIGWPGVLTFMVASFVGLGLRGGVGA